MLLFNVKYHLVEFPSGYIWLPSGDVITVNGYLPSGKLT
jgi:hypothetical protein